MTGQIMGIPSHKKSVAVLRGKLVIIAVDNTGLLADAGKSAKIKKQILKIQEKRPNNY